MKFGFERTTRRAEGFIHTFKETMPYTGCRNSETLSVTVDHVEIQSR